MSKPDALGRLAQLLAHRRAQPEQQRGADIRCMLDRAKRRWLGGSGWRVQIAEPKKARGETAISSLEASVEEVGMQTESWSGADVESDDDT